MNLYNVNYARKRPLTIRIVKDNFIAVAYEVRLFYLAVVKAKISMVSCVYYYESLQLCLYY